IRGTLKYSCAIQYLAKCDFTSGNLKVVPHKQLKIHTTSTLDITSIKDYSIVLGMREYPTSFLWLKSFAMEYDVIMPSWGTLDAPFIVQLEVVPM
ncbi:hypothetical protein ACJX0J_037394, partial [Zea mays]